MAAKETDMRVWHLIFVAGVGLALAGCTTPPSKSGGPSGKLQEDIIGKWSGERSGNKITYEFSKDGTFSFESGKIKVTGGNWKAVDNKEVELTYTLTKEQADRLKDDWKAEIAAIDSIRNLPDLPTRTKPPEPKEGENKVTRKAQAIGDALSLDMLVLRKAT
jgi:hypothetical protein